METKLIRDNNTNEKVNHFLINWHKFTFDYWWRKKYNIAFGSPQHREMNFIDMFIEYKEEVLFNKYLNEDDKEENEDLGLNVEGSEVKLTQEEIDKDYDEMDLTQFNKE